MELQGRRQARSPWDRKCRSVTSTELQPARRTVGGKTLGIGISGWHQFRLTSRRNPRISDVLCIYGWYSENHRDEPQESGWQFT